MAAKRTSIVAAALAMALASSSEASRTVVIGDFEDGTAQGWFAQDARTMTIVPDTFTGNGFLALVDWNGVIGFEWTLKNSTNPDLALLNNENGPQILEFDIYWDPPADWAGIGVMSWEAIAYNYDGGWTQVSQPTVPSDKQYSTSLGPTARHLVWDFIASGNPLSGTPSSFFQILLATSHVDTNFPQDQVSRGRYYIDNITITVPDAAIEADLALSVAVDDPFPLEAGTIEYTVTLSNNGPDSAYNVQISDLLPAGVTFLNAVATDGSWNDGSGVWTGLWSIVHLEPTHSCTLKISASVDPGTLGNTISNSVSVTALDQVDPVPGNDAASVDITVSANVADLTLSMAVDDPTPTEGGQARYTITLANNGPRPVGFAQVSDPLPAGLILTDVSASKGFYDSAFGIWELNGVQISESETLVLDVAVGPGTAGSTITNTASVVAVDLEDPAPGDETDSVDIDVAVVVGIGPSTAVALRAVQPNPFQWSATIRFDLPRAQRARIAVYDVAGRLVRTLFDGAADEGQHTVNWDGRDASRQRVASGVYFVRMDASAYSATQKVLKMNG